MATSSRTIGEEAVAKKRNPYAASIEEVEDDDVIKSRQKPTLPADGRHMIIEESELIDRSEKGVDEQDRPERPTKSQRKTAKIEKPIETPKEQAKSLFDRPIPPTSPEWIGDPRLPKELNDIMATTVTANQRWKISDLEEYREAYPFEVSSPIDFTTYLRPEVLRPERQRIPRFRLPTVDDSEQSLKALVKRYEKRGLSQATPYTSHNEKKGSSPLSEADIPRLKQQWYDEFQEILQGVKEDLPPLREVNHEINLIDPNLKYTYHLPRCPVMFREQFFEKLNRYINAGWWEPRTTAQAAPMLCVAKKDGRLRTVIDARQRNDNTVKDVTPLPDQEIIREDVARAPIRSKIDLADAYEQVRVRPEDVGKTAFATIAGTFVSNVVQQGDCNAPATFQRLMTAIFRDVIGRFLHVYLDDIFVFSDSIEEHEHHLRVVFERLRDNQLHLKWAKCELYAKEVECLGHVINDQGIHPDADKMQRIRDWRVPRDYNDVQRFVGLVNYVANFLPDITTYTAPLQSMVQNGAPFFWRPLHQRCFEMIKRICCKTPILRPIDHREKEPVWLICDASKTGVGAMYGQGPTWNVCRPAGFMSKKFTYAQQHYTVHELETLAILEALHKWEDKLIGRRVHIITDHKALEFFKTQSVLSNRQRRWIDYMARFDFDITYVKGEYNKIADCLSRYYESDTSADVHEFHEYVQSDRMIDPDGEDLPMPRLQEIKERTIEIRAMQAIATRRSRRLQEAQEQREEEAEIMNQPDGKRLEVESQQALEYGPKITLGDALSGQRTRREPTAPRQSAWEDTHLRQKIKSGYAEDPLTKMVLENPEDHEKYFTVKEGILWTLNAQRKRVAVIPRDRELIAQVLSRAHEIVGHLGSHRTLEHVRNWYWWPQMTKATEEFCRTCEACQRSKRPPTKPAGKLHSLPIPNKPWDSIGMDFVGPFPESKGCDYLWVVICRMTNMVHLIPVTTRVTASELSWIYLREIVRLHGLPSSIVSDRDSKFTARWWRELHRILGAKLLMSTSFHPQTDGQSERAIRTVSQILRSIVRPDQKDWVEKIDMVEFAINSSVSETTGYAPFDLNGGYMPSMIKEIRSNENVAPGIKAFALSALEKLADAHDAIIEARAFQTRAANKKRGPEPQIAVGDLVYLSTKNLNIPKNRARKLCPKYIGPYKVAEARPDTSTYTLELPAALRERRILSTFHVSLLKPYHASSDAMFPNRLQPEPYDFGSQDDQEWFVDEIIGHRWVGPKQIEYQVRWSLGDTTWETHANCNKLAALDRYLELQGVKTYTKLSRRDA